MQEITPDNASFVTPIQTQQTQILDASQVDNAVLERLIAEVKGEHAANQVNAYNRSHNRHNRGR